MSTLSFQSVAQELLGYATRRPQLHGKWIPVVYWAKRIQYRLGGEVITDKKIQKIMESQGLVGTDSLAPELERTKQRDGLRTYTESNV